MKNLNNAAPHLESEVAGKQGSSDKGKFKKDIEEAVEREGIAPFLDHFETYLSARVDTKPSAITVGVIYGLYLHFYRKFKTAPRLAVVAPVYESGKSTYLDIIAWCAPKRIYEPNITGAGLARRLHKEKAPAFVDDVHHSLTPEMLKVLCNGFYRAQATYTRADSRAMTKLHTFKVDAPIAFGMNLDNRTLPGELAGRSIIVRMVRGRPAHGGYEIGDGEHELASVRLALKHFAKTTKVKPKPTLPKGLQGRAADRWRPLFAVAEAAGPKWHAKVERAAEELEAKRQELPPKVALLAHIREVLHDLDVPGIPPQKLVEQLRDRYPDVYDEDLNPKALNGMLQGFYDYDDQQIKGRHWIKFTDDELSRLELDADRHKGYRRRDFEPSWKAYLESGENLEELLNQPL